MGGVRFKRHLLGGARLAAGKGGGGLAEMEVVEADALQEGGWTAYPGVCGEYFECFGNGEVEDVGGRYEHAVFERESRLHSWRPHAA